MIKLFMMILIMTILGAWGSYCFKKASANKNWLNLNICLGCFLYTSGMIVNILALTYYDYTIVFPLTSLTYIWSFILGVKLLHEKFNAYNLCGVCLIIGGAFVLGIA